MPRNFVFLISFAYTLSRRSIYCAEVDGRCSKFGGAEILFDYHSTVDFGINHEFKRLSMENPWRGRGRARGPRPPTYHQIRPQDPRLRPNQQQVDNMPPRFVRRPEIRLPRVEEIGQVANANRINNLERGYAPMINNKAAVQDCQPIENQYFRLARPASSTTESGKQGSIGKPIELIANYFPITTYTDWSLYQYRVDFNPEQERINIKRGLLSAHKEFLGAYIFDGTMLFSRKNFQRDTVELTSKRNTDGQLVIMTIKFTAVVEKGDHTCIQIFNILMRKSLGNLKLTLVGRNYYDKEAKTNLPNHKLELWPGYDTTIGVFDYGLLLRSEIKTKIMREDTVLDLLIECSKNKSRDSDWMMTFKLAVLGSIVLTRYNNKTYRIDDIDEESSTRSTFLKKDGSKISFIDYYKERYGITISNQKQPMLISKKKKSFNCVETELVYLVPELCTLTGITNKMRENRYLMQDIAQHTRVDPNGRIVMYNNFIKRVLTTPKSSDLLKEWNLTLSNALVTIHGRVLPQENLYGDNHKYPAGYNNNWSSKLRSLPMYNMIKIPCWAIVTPYMWSSDVGRFANSLVKIANNLGFPLQRPRIVEIEDIHIRTYSIHLDRTIHELNPSFILCVVASSRNDLYNMIKRKLCITRAVPSQVVLLKNVQNEKTRMSVCTKIAIQINCKLGGAPWRVVIPEPNMMIVGFDVFHDTKSGKKSYGALIATMNDSHTSFFSCVDKHESGQELSTHFGTSIHKALTKYREKNNKLPNTIVIYRDGVGDGNLSYVHKVEVDMVKKTCKELYGDKKFGLAFIIVKKRIGARFFLNTKEEREHYQNPPVGTIVDSGITDPTMYDFYLVSQHVTMGTVTPTHYNVIVDTLNETATKPITPNVMQQLTYKLTHMYYNWTGTVRVPALCQLAHKLAYLAGQSLQSNPNSGLEDSLYFL
ncbi:piwi-like protein Siwi [Aphis gossypii]|uniref:piwi-like protein Siwi n=1 Tax=Aphis gossypii TaxID=80765 RepID=UPI002159ABCC|nr:piwi-like protein Siwi [Aphis gossypii]